MFKEIMLNILVGAVTTFPIIVSTILFPENAEVVLEWTLSFIFIGLGIFILYLIGCFWRHFYRCAKDKNYRW